PMSINILSFGFKYGVPSDASLIMDVRFLSNPHFVPDLKVLDGKAEKVQNYVLNNDDTRTFLKKYLDFLDYLIPLYEKEGKAYLTIGVGCTGGRHRSVVIAEAISKHINKPDRKIMVTHRDIDL
ncbi:MAG: RNase adapter RapZ, partial [Desulfobacterales bacterium]